MKLILTYFLFVLLPVNAFASADEEVNLSSSNTAFLSELACPGDILCFDFLQQYYDLCSSQDITISTALYNGNDVLLVEEADPGPFCPGSCTVRRQVYTCSGELIDDCSTGGSPPLGCVTGFNGTVIDNLQNIVSIWTCFDAVPDCLSTGVNCIGLEITTINCGQSITSNTFSSQDDNSDYSCFNLNNGKEYNGRDLLFEFEHEGGPASITLFNNNTEDLDIFLLEGCITFVPFPGNPPPTFTCIASSTGNPINSANVNYENIYIDFLPSGFYQIIVDGATSADASAFRLTYNCEDQICGYDDELECGITLNHSNIGSGYTNDVTNYCGQGGRVSGSACDGPERVYRFEVAPGEEGIYTFTLNPTSASDDFELFLIDDAVSVGPTVIGGGGGTNCAGNCVESPPVLTGPGDDEVITEFLSAGTYLVVVDGWNGSEGSYSLRADCPSIVTCDDPPNSLDLRSIGLSHISIGWPTIPGTDVSIQHRRLGTSTWSNPEQYTSGVVYSNRLPCTFYQFRVRYECDGISGDWSNVFTYRTECETENYCHAYGRSFDEWIDLVRVAGIDNTTGNGYGHEWYLEQVGEVIRGESYPITLSANKRSSVSAVTGFWRVYIDFNGDDDFADANENVLSLTGTSNGTVNGSINIPSGSFSGNTRMRVIFSIEGFRTSCEIDGDADVEDYTINVIEEPCPDPQNITNCPGQSYFQNSNGTYSVSAIGSVAANQPWLVGGTSQSVTGSTLVITPPGDDVEICYPFTNNEGCIDYCCRDYCFSSDFNPAINFAFTNDGNTLTLELDASGTSQRTWYYYNGSNRITAGTGITLSVTLPGVCLTRTYYVRYFQNGCWRTISRTIYICNPFDCNGINITYNATAGTYGLTLSGNAQLNTISWIDDDDDGSIIEDGDRDIDIPERGINCGERNISVRYWDGFTWRICCISFWDCDPYNCGFLDIVPVDVGGNYSVNFNGPSNATDILWIDDDTGEEIPGDGDFVPLPIPDECVVRNISIRYFDPGSGTYRICCISEEICPPVTCDDPVFSQNCSGQIYQPLPTGGYSVAAAGATMVEGQWLINGQPSTTNQILVINPDDGDNARICYPYLDNEGCTQYCCQDYCFTEDDNPAINYSFVSDGSQLQLTVGQIATSQRRWFYFDGSSQVNLGNGTSVIDDTPPPGQVCSYRTYYLTYFDGNCWRTISRRIYRCNPFDCGNISYEFNANSNSFILELETAIATQIQWIDDDTDQDLPGTGRILPLPIDSDCRTRNISVRYWDGNGWRVCCLSYWSCDPFDCNLLVFDPTPVGSNYHINFTGPANASEILWIDDDTGEELPGDGDFLPLPIPDECEIRNISIRYFDPGSGTYRICCLSRQICPPVICDDPIFLDNCSNQSLLRLPNNSYQISASISLAPDQSWLIDGQFVNAFNQELVFNRDNGDNNRICFPYLDEEGCLQYCCQDYCFTEDSDPAIDYNFVSDGSQLQLTVGEIATSQRRWYYFDGANEVNLGTGTSVIDIVPPPGNGCSYRTYYLTYYDGNCWRTISRRIFLCNPFECGSISYDFNAGSNTFNLELETSSATQIQWIDDDTDEDLPGDGTVLPLPIDPDCRTRNISVRYWDGNGWRVCCIRVDVCDPFECRQIVPLFNEDQNSFILSLSGSAGLQDISWIDDDTDEGLPGDDDEIILPIIGPCRDRNISVRYFDPISGAWGLCCVRYEQCPPENCATNVSFLQQDNGSVLFTTVVGASQQTWWVNDTLASSSSSLSLVIPPGEEREICVRYFDVTSETFHTCCRMVEIPDCQLPTPTFTLNQNLDSVYVLNSNPEASVSHFWEFSNVSTSSQPSPSAQRLPPGIHQVCLTVTDDCGAQRSCIAVTIPDIENDFILQLQSGLCGAAGEIICVPVTALNYENILNFQLTLGIADTSVARIVGFQNSNIPGLWDHNIVGEGKGVSVLYFNDLGLFYPDETVICTLKVEIMSQEAPPTDILLLQSPVPAYAENGNAEEIEITLIQAPIGPCNEVSLAGTIHTEDGQGIAKTTVELLRNNVVTQSIITDQSGAYAFVVTPDDGEYTVRPTKDSYYRNHVNSGDLSAIRKHIFAIESLQGPYRRIAADVSGPARINSGDLSAIRRLIFGQTVTFPDVQSWSFVPTSHQFTDPQEPTVSEYPKSIDLGILIENREDLNFIGVKMGDPSAGADPSNLQSPISQSRSHSGLQFTVDSIGPIRGTPWEIDIYAHQFKDMVAAQFSLSWDPELLGFLEVRNLNETLALNIDENFTRASANEGKLPWLWFTDNAPVSLEDSTVLFTLRLNVIGNIGDSICLAFGEEPTVFYFEDANGELTAETEKGDFIIQQSTSTHQQDQHIDFKVFPNPASQSVRIVSERSENLDVTLLDISGRVVRQWPGHISGSALPINDISAGVYLLQLQQGYRMGLRRLVIKN